MSHPKRSAASPVGSSTATSESSATTEATEPTTTAAAETTTAPIRSAGVDGGTGDRQGDTPTPPPSAERTEHEEQDDDDERDRKATGVVITRARATGFLRLSIQRDVESRGVAVSDTKRERFDRSGIVLRPEAIGLLTAQRPRHGVSKETLGTLPRFDPAPATAVGRRFLGHDEDDHPRVAGGVTDLRIGADLPFAPQTQRHLFYRTSAEVGERHHHHVAAGGRIEAFRQRRDALLGVRRNDVGEVVDIAHRLRQRRGLGVRRHAGQHEQAAQHNHHLGSVLSG